MLETPESMASADERLCYLEPRSRQNVDAVPAPVDLLVLPSLRNCGAYTVPEAMRAGCPVRSTPVGGMTEILAHEVTGFLSRGTGTDALALAPLIRDSSVRGASGFRNDGAGPPPRSSAGRLERERRGGPGGGFGSRR